MPEPMKQSGKIHYLPFPEAKPREVKNPDWADKVLEKLERYETVAISIVVSLYGVVFMLMIARLAFGW
jgi:hypothetical protein